MNDDGASLSENDVDIVSTASPQPGAGKIAAEDRMNAECFCVSLNHAELHNALRIQLGSPELQQLMEERCPTLFSSMPVFISAVQRKKMEAAVQAIASVIAMPAYQARVLADAPSIARHDPGGVKGVFFGYDFHLGGGDIGLIEINTNAGGAMLNALMARAHRSCSINAEQLAEAAASGPNFENAIIEMFRSEWAGFQAGRPLQSIAIVDERPAEQFLYPEFLLFKQLFESHGLHAIVADPSELTWRQGTLWHGDRPIDMVYNRLTDFMLAAPGSSALRAAYLAGAVALTPHPRAHALYADKRNLALLSDRYALDEIGVPAQVRDRLLAVVLPTEVVRPEENERLWANRRHLFFKPNAGFGGRAAYRGDKLTRRVWQEILANDYVAQALMVPGARVVGTRQQPESLKFDVRLYVYDGAVQWTAARVYQGQTTNFRTPGGGFAPVYSLPDIATACGAICTPP